MTHLAGQNRPGLARAKALAQVQQRPFGPLEVRALHAFGVDEIPRAERFGIFEREESRRMGK